MTAKAEREANKMTPSEYWKQNKQLLNITPNGERFPETGLEDAMHDAITGSVFEFGCGDGRLSSMFDHDKYAGFDINQTALDAAKTANPLYNYVTDMEEDVKSDTFLAFTVLLHIPDDEIEALCSKMAEYERVVIGEIMGRKWRRGGLPPVFNREIDEYKELIGRDCKVIKVPYPRYSCDLDLLVFE